MNIIKAELLALRGLLSAVRVLTYQHWSAQDSENNTIMEEKREDGLKES